LSDETTPRPSLRPIVLALLGIIVVLGAVFGAVTMHHRGTYEDYRRQTLEEATLPWERAELSPEACVEFAVDWAMACPGLESWCANEAPVLARRCLEAADRTSYCASVADVASSTRFGVAQCEDMRADVQGRYTARNHKKLCAACYRAVAASCTESAPSR
jgi:hypothetical protein